MLTVQSSCFVSFSASKPIQELDCEENKLEVRLFDLIVPIITLYLFFFGG